MVHATNAAVKCVRESYQCHGTLTPLFLSKRRRLGWLAVVNALDRLGLASNQKVRDGIFCQELNRPSLPPMIFSGPRVDCDQAKCRNAVSSVAMM
jgi:hypothetical protein